MVILQPRAGMGNQLFQYAMARSLAYKLNTELKIDRTFSDRLKDLRIFQYHLDAFNIHEVFASPEELKSVNERDWKILKTNFIPINYNDNVFLQGGNWFYHESFFADVKDVVRREFTLRNPLHTNSARWKEKILSAKCPVSIHWRIGDYLLPYSRTWNGYTIPAEYYYTCVNELRKSYPDISLFVFSDDLDFARKNLKFDVPMEFVGGCEYDFEEMHLISLCKHNITVNSTFSWWGAWLNQNPDKKIFAPHFGVAPDNSIRVPVDLSKSIHTQFPLTLSIILHVGDNFDTVKNSMLSINSQSFNEYELIIVDSSTDGSGKFCRQFASNDNVVFLKAPRNAGKYECWNIGLECAQSEYVLFLTGKDFILSETLKELVIILKDLFVERSLKTRSYINFATYYENYCAKNPNIICTTKWLEENADGQFNIIEFQGKKFDALVDAAFQNLNTVTEIKIDAAQKLMLLATNQLNNLIGTKFFKLKFLRENKIRFDEKIGASAELMFIVDCFMRTENVILVPQIFYGRLGRD